MLKHRFLQETQSSTLGLDISGWETINSIANAIYLGVFTPEALDSPVISNRGEIFDFPDDQEQGNPFDRWQTGSVAIIPLSGIMLKESYWWGYGVDDVARIISLAYQSDKISAVILKANTPGGSTDSLYLLQEVLSEKIKPTYGYIDGMCASCGYIAMSYTDKLYAINKMVSVGGIGVYTRIALTVTAQLEGVSRRTLQFLSELNGERVILFWENCDTGERYIAGSPCSGCMLVVVTSIGRQDDGFNGVILEFRGGQCPNPFYFYEGPIILDTPQLVASNATTFALTAAYQYQLVENTSATVLTDISGITDDEVGRIIEIIGGGINFPTAINPGAKFILRNGVAWSGTQGSRISLLIVKTGPSTYAFFELNRA